MKRLLFILLLGSWLLTPSWAQPQAGHYTEIDGKSGEALFQAISTCAAQGHTRLSYDELWTAFGTTDLRENNIVWDMYSDCEYVWKTNQSTGSGKECEAGYNREHSIPKSWWGAKTESSSDKKYTDLFHLIPTDANVNSTRNNNPYGEIANPTKTTGNGSKLGKVTYGDTTFTAFEPIDAYKGDLARGVLGMLVHYNDDYTKQDGALVFSNDYTAVGNFGLTDYALNLFLKWHRNDPVSQKELDRNNGIEATQGNRNPFIDYPELVEYIWGNKKGRKLTLSSICSAYEKTCIPSDEAGTEEEDNKEEEGSSNEGETEVTGVYYAKVNEALDDYSGTYLVVYEKDSVVFNANAEQIGEAGNYLPAQIQEGIIYATTELDAAAITLTTMESGYSVSTPTGIYLLAGNGKNTIVTSETAYLHTVSVGTDANASIGCTTDVARVLRYLSSGKKYFRYYEDKTNTSSKPIQLYKKYIPSGTTGGVTTNLSQLQISVHGNQLVGQSTLPTDLWVYDYTGRLVLTHSQINTFEIILPSGFYLVRLGNTTTKIRIYE